MRDDQLCSNCEWWDTRCLSSTGPNPCLRWPEVGLRTGGGQRCWQWAAKAVDPEPEETDPEESDLDLGIPTDRARQLLYQSWAPHAVGEQRRVKARWDRARQLLYQACLSGLNDPPEGWDEEARQLLREGLLRAED